MKEKNKRKVRLTIYENNKVIIEDYNQLIDIDSKCIRIDYIKINGNNLRIIRMDDYMMEVNGMIKEVGLSDEEI